jgi:HSP20 family protein
MITIKKNKFPTRLPDFEFLGNTFSNLDKIFLGDDDFFSKNNFPRDFVFRNVKSNFLENDNSFILEIQIPGINKKDINISVDDFNLNIEFNKKEESLDEDTNYKLREFNTNSFSRSFFLPKSSNLDKITSKCENGILFIDIPKKESEINKKRTINIS